MKKLISLTLAILMLALCVSATGCSSKVKTLADVKAAGELVIATSPDFPPFESLGEGNEVVGIEIDILNAVCEKLGVKLTIKRMDFESVIPGVTSGKYDVGVSGITITEERAKNVLFTVPYCLAQQAIVVTADSAIASKADLENKTVSVQKGTTADIFCSAQGYTVKAFSGNTEAELALTSGKVDAWVIDDLTAVEMVKQYNEDQGKEALIILPEAMTNEPYAFAMKLGSDELCAEINKVLNEMIADGTIASLFEKYGAPYTSPVN
ncbi:MAG: transporter substrate-binding domain-containing protein [Clostridia bacterium]|nr:transporter substrate-binding domain-containing protein [Clostridia bacterium]